MRTRAGWWTVAGVGLIAAVVVGRQDMIRRSVGNESNAGASAVQAAAARPPTEPPLAADASTEAVEQARTEVAALREQVARARAAQCEEEARRRFAVGVTMVESQWKNAGTATVQAALETVLWSAANGELETLASTIGFVNKQTRTMAESLRQSLPAEMRAEISTPERLLAFLTINDVPRGSAQVRKYSPLDGWPAGAQLVDLYLVNEDGTPRDTKLIFMPLNEEWKLIANENVVAKYAAMLKQPLAGASPAKR